MADYNYGPTILAQLQHKADQQREEMLLQEERERGSRLNLPGALAGLLTGGIKEGMFDKAGITTDKGLGQNITDTLGSVDWGKLASAKGTVGGLMGGITPTSENPMRDLLAGGVSAYSTLTKEEEEAKERQLKEEKALTDLTEKYKVSTAKEQPTTNKEDIFVPEGEIVPANATEKAWRIKINETGETYDLPPDNATLAAFIKEAKSQKKKLTVKKIGIVYSQEGMTPDASYSQRTIGGKTIWTTPRTDLTWQDRVINKYGPAVMKSALFQGGNQ